MIAFEGITYSYPHSEHPALRGVNLRTQGVTCVLGASGCGKSTLIGIAAGYLTPDGGTATYQGMPISPKHVRIGLIPQDTGLLGWLTAEQNAALGLRLKEGRVDLSQVHAVLKSLGILSLKDRKPAQLSGGQRQRVAVARALTMDAQILLMDEPFSALDAASREDAQDFLRDVVKRTNADVLLVTHSVEEAAVLGSTIAVMGEGVIREVFANPLADCNDPRAQAEFYPLCARLRNMMKESGNGDET